MKRVFALATMLALVCLSGASFAGQRAKEATVPWASSRLYANTTPTLYAYRQNLPALQLDTTGVFFLQDARPPLMTSAAAQQAVLATAGTTTSTQRDSMPMFAKFTVCSDSSTAGFTADTLVLTLYAVSNPTANGSALTSSPNQTTVVDIGNLKGVQIYRATVGGFSTDNTVGCVDVPFLLGGAPGVGTSNVTTTTAGNLTFAVPTYGAHLSNGVFAVVKTVGGAIPQARFTVRYFVDDPSYNGN